MLEREKQWKAMGEAMEGTRTLKEER